MYNHPEYNAKIRLMQALGPVARMDRTTCPLRIFAPYANQLEVGGPAVAGIQYPIQLGGLGHPNLYLSCIAGLSAPLTLNGISLLSFSRAAHLLTINGLPNLVTFPFFIALRMVVEISRRRYHLPVHGQKNRQKSGQERSQAT